MGTTRRERKSSGASVNFSIASADQGYQRSCSAHQGGSECGLRLAAALAARPLDSQTYQLKHGGLASMTKGWNGKAQREFTARWARDAIPSRSDPAASVQSGLSRSTLSSLM